MPPGPADEEACAAAIPVSRVAARSTENNTAECALDLQRTSIANNGPESVSQPQNRRSAASTTTLGDIGIAKVPVARSPENRKLEGGFDPRSSPDIKGAEADSATRGNADQDGCDLAANSSAEQKIEPAEIWTRQTIAQDVMVAGLLAASRIRART